MHEWFGIANTNTHLTVGSQYGHGTHWFTVWECPSYGQNYPMTFEISQYLIATLQYCVTPD